MRRQFLTMMITAIALSLLSLGGCGSTSVNVSSTPAQATTPAVGEKQTEVSSVPTKAPTQPGVEQRVMQQAQHAVPANRADEVIRQAREALGGEAKLKEVQNFTVAGSFRRVSNGLEQSGERRMDLLWPDKFKISDTLSLIAGLELTVVSALNGGQAWSDSRTSGGSAQVMTMTRGNEQQDSEAQVKRLRAEFTRYLLALFLMPPSGTSIEYGGEAEAADGRADILIFKDANGGVVRLFIDKNTHRPLMMSYRAIAVRVKTTRSVAGAGDIDKVAKDAQTKAPAGEESDMQMHFSDYKPEKGILLPHLIVITLEDKPHEEWSLKSFKFNSPDLTAKKFEKG